MRYSIRSAFLFLLVLGSSLAIGCSEKSTEPENPSPATGMKHLWSRHFGDGSHQYALAVAVDTSGNGIVTGPFYGTIDFGSGPLISEGDVDIFVAKFGSDGACLWSKRFGDETYQSASAVAVDRSGNVIVTGVFTGTVNFGGGSLTSAGSGDIFVAKFGSDGTHLWSKRFGEADIQEPRSIAVDASGNVIVAGCFAGAVDFGGGSLTSAGSEDIFVVKFGSDGAHLWSKRFGDANRQFAQAVASDASGNAIIAGYFYGTADFGGGLLTSAGSGDVFAAKFGPDGTYLWGKRFGDGDYQEAQGIATDASGNVIIGGYFYGAVDFGGGSLTSAGMQDIFVAQLGSDGAHVWSKRFGDGGTQIARAVGVDASARVIITGYFDGAVDFGGGSLASAGSVDVFVANFTAAGNYITSKRFGDGSYQEARSVAADPLGNVIVTGYFDGTTDFGGGPLTSAGGADIFVAMFGW